MVQHPASVVGKRIHDARRPESARILQIGIEFYTVRVVWQVFCENRNSKSVWKGTVHHLVVLQTPRSVHPQGCAQRTATATDKKRVSARKVATFVRFVELLAKYRSEPGVQIIIEAIGDRAPDGSPPMEHQTLSQQSRRICQAIWKPFGLGVQQ